MMRLLGGAIGSFIAIVCFAIIIECPKKYLPLAGVIGAVGGTVYLFCLNIVKTDAVLAAFFSALAITILSHIFAKGFRAPVTIFLIPGILSTVPGAGMYRIVYYLVAGNQAKCAFYFAQTLEIAGMIALAIFLVGTIVNVIRKSKKIQEKSPR